MSGVVFALGVIFVMAAMAGLFKPKRAKCPNVGKSSSAG